MLQLLLSGAIFIAMIFIRCYTDNIWLGLVAFFLGFGVIAIDYGGRPDMELEWSIDIVALQDNVGSNVHGGGFIATHITTEGAQRYFYAVDKGEYKTIEYIEGLGDHVRIVYDDDVHPQIQKRSKPRHWRYAHSEYDMYYKIIVPTGTVQEGYNIDLQ